MKYDFELDTESNNSLSLIIKQLKSNSTVLEFGPANGRLTRYMKEALNCQVYLVELDEEAGKEALNYGVDLVIGDIETYKWKDRYKETRFDHIIFADVLEHLRNPLDVLKEAKEFLKEDGSILLSVPNLSHNSVLIDLLNNKFEYNYIGLLDDTHIHFFTKSSLDKMIQAAGLFISKEMATYAKVGTTEIKNNTYDVKGIKPSYWNKRPQGQIYQYVYEVSPVQVDKICQIKEDRDDYWFQLYYLKGSEWSENNSITQIIDINDENQQIEVQLPEGVKEFRFDPVNTSGIISMFDIYGMKDGERVEASYKASNDRAVYSNTFVFDNADPQIYYEFENIADRVIIQYQINELEISQNMGVQGASKDYEDIIVDLMHANCRLQDEMDTIRAQRDLLQQQRDNLESKWLYKVYRKIRCLLWKN